MFKIFYIILSLFLFGPLYAGQKVIEKGVMEVTDDNSGSITYKILWSVPGGQDSFWLDAVPTDSNLAFSGEVQTVDPNMEMISAISHSNYTVTNEGMDRAVRAINDAYRKANPSAGGGNSSSGGSC